MPRITQALLANTLRRYVEKEKDVETKREEERDGWWGAKALFVWHVYSFVVSKLGFTSLIV